VRQIELVKAPRSNQGCLFTGPRHHIGFVACVYAISLAS
jgi:hypothetical protein